MIICSVGGCSNKHKGHGYCNKHLLRLRNNGDPLVTKRVTNGSSDLERLLFYGWTVQSNGCWTWNGQRIRSDYGRIIALGGKAKFAHRAAYEVWVGPIPDGKILRHKCDNPPCINPEHLDVGTYQDNSNDMINRKRWSGNGHITQHDADTIRVYLSAGRDVKSLAVEFGISRASIYDIKKLRTWTKHVTDE
jgi:hypothetical protein